MNLRFGLTTAILLLCAGCGSSPETHFYTLSAAQTGNRKSVSFPIQVAAVHLPPSLDRRQMVRMTGGNRVEMSETNRWSGPFDEMVRNVLSQDLAARLPEDRLILPEAPPPTGTRALVVTLAQFGPDATGEVKLSGSWALLGSGSDVPIMQRNVSLRAGSAPDADAMAAGMSRALGELADAIAAAL